ncbi:hypothetical protein [Clostridium diolis]|uniref:hypothetical protein n=1 Tax=Clostridium diolis TaxID=223919 RepID=UPI003AF47A59
MKWNKQGLIFSPKGEFEWMQSYALIPTADIISNDTVRIYFATLDREMYGRIGYIDVDMLNLKNIKNISEKPVLDIGDIGTFDDSGVNPSCILTVDNKKYLYYYGWQRCERVPHMLFAGLATSEDGENFTKVSRVPVLDRTKEEPYLRSATSIIVEDNIFKCWYVSAINWILVNDKSYPKYVIKYAYSYDGIEWISENHTCISFKNEYEYGFGRPWVVKENDMYKMWYSIRSINEPYKIGFATSKNGLDWTRLDEEAGIEKSESGWDSEMICYPNIVKFNSKTYMFYNGNRHGKTGFGYAILEE